MCLFLFGGIHMNIPEFFVIKNFDGQTTAYLSPESDSIKDAVIDVRLNGESVFEFKIPANSEKLAELTSECRIIAGGREFTIHNEDSINITRDEQGKLWAVIKALESWYMLDYKYKEPYVSNDPNTLTPADLAVIIVAGGSNLSGGLYSTGSAGHALYAILQGTGWSVGTVDVTGVHDLETEKESILMNIKKVQEIWGGYLVFDSINKTVSLRYDTAWQPYTGFQVRYAKNLKSITRTQYNKLITKLYPFGKDDLDIASVNGGEKFLKNSSYTSREYVGIIKYPDIEDAQELKDKAASELSLICRPKYLYSVKMVDLRTLPEYSHEDFSLGDIVDVIDPALGSAQVRLLRHKYYLFQPWKCELEIGEPLPRPVEKLIASFNTTSYIDSILTGRGQLPGGKLVDLSVTYDQLANASITTAKIANLAVNTTKLANLAVEAAKLANSSVVAEKIASAAVGSAAIANAAIGTAHIGTGVILTAHIGDAQIVNAKIGDLAVNTAKISDLAVTNVKIADLAVTNAKIASLAVTDAKIQSLSASKLTAGTIDANVISVVNLNASYITAGSLSADRISGGTISSSTINVTTNATIGNALNIGGLTADVAKGINFRSKDTQECNISMGQLGELSINATPGLNLYAKDKLNITMYDISGSGLDMIINHSSGQGHLKLLNEGSGNIVISPLPDNYCFIGGKLKHTGTQLGFFNTTPVAQQTAQRLSSKLTVEDADLTYGSIEVAMLTHLKNDVQILYSKINGILDKLELYGLLDVYY